MSDAESRPRVKSRHSAMSAECSLYPDERRSTDATGMSAWCQSRPNASQQIASLFDDLVGGRQQRRQDGEAENPGSLGVNDRPVRTWSIAPPASPPAWFLRGCVRHRCSSDDRHPPGSPPSSSTRRLRPVACCNATPATGATQNAPQKGRTKLIRRFPKL